MSLPTVRIGSKDLPLDMAEASVQRQANWFFWIAALSIVNWIAGAMKATFAMVVGLGITQVASSFASVLEEDGAARTVLSLLAVAVTAAMAAVFVFLGYKGRQVRPWAFLVGIVLYALDALIFLWVKDWIGLGFHAFVLFNLIMGLTAARAVRATRASLPAVSPTPSPIG